MPWTLKFWNSNPQIGPVVTWNYGGNSNPPQPQPGDVPAQPGMTIDITNYLNSIASISTYAQSRLSAYGQDIRFGYQAGNEGEAVWRGGIDPYVRIDLFRL
jgi:hypothetical protein